MRKLKSMQRAIIYFLVGTVLGFLLNYFLLGSQGWALDLYYATAFGLAWAIAFILDDVRFTLAQKFGISFAAMAGLLLLGSLIFNAVEAVPAVIKFSIVFVAYYLIASLRPTKSLRK